jgi:hypothetical protein
MIRLHNMNTHTDTGTNANLRTSPARPKRPRVRRPGSVIQHQKDQDRRQDRAQERNENQVVRTVHLLRSTRPIDRRILANHLLYRLDAICLPGLDAPFHAREPVHAPCIFECPVSFQKENQLLAEFY